MGSSRGAKTKTSNGVGGNRTNAQHKNCPRGICSSSPHFHPEFGFLLSLNANCGENLVSRAILDVNVGFNGGGGPEQRRRPWRFWKTFWPASRYLPDAGRAASFCFGADRPKTPLYGIWLWFVEPTFVPRFADGCDRLRRRDPRATAGAPGKGLRAGLNASFRMWTAAGRERPRQANSCARPGPSRLPAISQAAGCATAKLGHCDPQGYSRPEGGFQVLKPICGAPPHVPSAGYGRWSKLDQDANARRPGDLQEI